MPGCPASRGVAHSASRKGGRGEATGRAVKWQQLHTLSANVFPGTETWDHTAHGVTSGKEHMSGTAVASTVEKFIEQSHTQTHKHTDRPTNKAKIARQQWSSIGGER